MRRNAYQGSSFTRLDNPNDPNLPQSYQDTAAEAYQNAAAQYNNSFQSRHPKLSTGLEAAAGLVLFGPLGLGLGPLAGQRIEARRKAGVVQDYQNALSTLADQQNKLLPTQQVIGDDNLGITQIQSRGFQAPYQQGAILSPAARQNAIDSATAGADINDAQQQILGTQAASLGNARQAYDSVTGGGVTRGLIAQPQNMPAIPGYQNPYSESNPIQSVVQNDYQAPLQPYRYTNPDIAKALIPAMAQITNTATTQLPDYVKAPGEVLLNMAKEEQSRKEADAAQALAGLRGQQTITERGVPALNAARANEANSSAAYNRRRYAGGPAQRAPNVIDLMTPQQRMQYAARVAQGVSPEQAAGEVTTTYQRDAQGRVTSSTRSRGGTGGTTQIKGTHGTYSF
jgi:YD repeat-containing protein